MQHLLVAEKQEKFAESLSPSTRENVGKQQCELIGALSKLVIVFYLLKM